MRKTRQNLSDRLLDFMNCEMQVMYSFTSWHLSADYLVQLSELQKEFRVLEQLGMEMIENEIFFGWPKLSLDLLAGIEFDLQTHTTLWELCKEVPKAIRQMKKQLARELNVDRILHSCNQWIEQLAVMLREFDQTRTCFQLASDLNQQVHQIVDVIPVLQVWTNPNMHERHWAQTFQILKKEMDTEPENILFGTMYSWKPSGYAVMTQFRALNEAVGNEIKLEATIEAMQLQWDSFAIPIRALGNTGTFYVENFGEASLIVQEAVIKMDGIINLKTGTEEAREKAKKWQQVTRYTDFLLSTWSRTQQQFLSIRPLFASVLKMLSPQDLFVYKRVERLWEENMKIVFEQPSLGTISQNHDLMTNFQAIEHNLEFLRRIVDTLVSNARSGFARFYFVTEHDVIDFLTLHQGNFADVYLHIRKIFPGVSSFTYQSDLHQVSALKSRMGESIPLVPAVHLSTDEPLFHKNRLAGREAQSPNMIHPDTVVENSPLYDMQKWLAAIETVMFASIHRQIDRARKAYEFSNFDKWMMDNTQQSMAVAQSILYTVKVEDVLSDLGNTRRLLSDCITTKQCIVETVVETLAAQNTELRRHKCKASVIQNISERDMLQKLLDEDPQNTHDFAWQSQFRYAWTLEHSVDGQIYIEIMGSRYPYGLEYLGNCTPLVWSTSVERCYKIVGCALSSYVWGALAGNASTCTSLITSMANSFGTVCFSLGCDLVPGPTVIHQLCKGIASSSYWLAFKSIDHATPDMLQTLSTSIAAVQNAVRAGMTEASIGGSSVRMQPLVGGIGDRPPPGFFVTFCRHLQGQVLPSSLATLFRPIVIHTPDIAHVMEVILLANGFKTAATLARKAHFTFQILRQRLIVASHYNFSKSALMDVIYDVIRLKTEYPDEHEMKMLIKALFLKAPCIQPADQSIFYDVVSALADVNVSAISNSCNLAGKFAILLPKFLDFENHISLHSDSPIVWAPKVIELFAAACTRSGVIAIGQACTGKTSCIQAMTDTLKKALALNVNSGGVETHCIFPKALSIQELYGCAGRVSTHSLEWIDGIIPKKFRSMAEARKEAHSKAVALFLIMDAPMDPDWSDWLTLALGAEKHLQLPSFEKVPAPELNTFVFEGEDVSTASPATISRCGIVFFHSPKEAWIQSAVLQASDWEDNILNQWIQLNENAFATGKDIFDTLLEHVMGPTLRFVALECNEMPIIDSDTHRVWTHLKLFERLCLECLLEQAKQEENKKGNLRIHCEWLTNNFLFSLVCSVGSLLNVQSQQKFESFLRILLSRFAVDMRAEKRNGKSTHADFTIVAFQRSESIFEIAYAYTSTRKGWIPWKETPAATMYQEVSGQRLEDLVVPTLDFVRYNCLLGWIVDARCPILMVGPPASGKSMYIRTKMRNYFPASKFATATFNMSPSTTLENLQHLIWQRLEAKAVGRLAPKGEKHFVLFIEDLNLAKRDSHGSSAALELIRLLLDKKSGYSREMPPVLNSIEKVLLIATHQHTQGSFSSSIPNRLVRQFFLMNVSASSDEEIRNIFSASLEWYHARQEFPECITALRDMVIDASIALYREVRTRLTPTVLCPHYIFCLRDLMAVLAGMMLQTKEDIQASSDSPENEHLRLWAHEVLRVFYDRVKDEKDKAWFLDTLKSVVRQYLNQDFDTLFKHLDLNDDGDIDAYELRRLFFGSYQTGPGAPRKRGEAVGYDEIENPDEMVGLLATFCTQYDADHAQPMNLFMSLYCAEHINRLARVLQVRRGHALLLGATGVGRRCLTRIAAYVGRTKINEIYADPETDTGRKEWRDHFKRLIRLCGLGFAPNLAVVLRDPVLTTERMQDICCILNGTEIPGLYTREEQASLVQEMLEQGLVEESIVKPQMEELFAQLLEMAYDSIHLVICVDPQIQNLRNLVTNYPSLVNRCYIDWFQDWPAETLQQMATQQQMTEPDLYQTIEMGPNFIDLFGKMHNLAQEISRSCMLQMNRLHVHITPTDYAFFLKHFPIILLARRKEIEAETAVLTAACNMSAYVTDRVKNVEEIGQNMLKENEETMAKVAIEQAALKTLESSVAILKKKVDRIKVTIAGNKKAQKNREEQLEIKREEIKEWWKTAAQCVLTLSPRDTAKLKSTVNMASKCPENIEDLSMAVSAILNGTLLPSEKKDERKVLMASCKKIVASLDFKKTLVAFSPVPDAADNLVKGAVIVRKRFLTKKMFNYDSCARVCAGSEKVFTWVSEALVFEEKFRSMIEPLTAQLDQLKTEFLPMEKEKKTLLGEHADTSAQLGDQRNILQSLNGDSSNFEERFASFNHETDLSNQFSKLLVNEYANFPKNWTVRLERLNRQQKTLDVDCLLAAAAITYLGGLPLEARELVMSMWIQLLVTEKLCPGDIRFDLAAVLIDSKELGLEKREFEFQGLPMDQLSVVNACIVTQSFKAPLVIDPHGVFTSWIQKREKANSLMIVSVKDDYLGKLRFAVEEGIPILVKNVDQGLPRALQSLSAKQFVIKQGRTSVFIGDVMVPYNAAFRLYMVTGDECPDFSPEHSSWTTLVDFNLSQAGFQQCILRGLVEEKLAAVHVYRSTCLEQYIASAKLIDEFDPKHFLPSDTKTTIIDENLIESISQKCEAWTSAREGAMDNLRKYKAASERANLLNVLALPLASLFGALWKITPLHQSYQNVQNNFVTLVLMDLESAEGNEQVSDTILRENTGVFEDLNAGFEALENEEDEREVCDLDMHQLRKDLSELGSALTLAVFLDLMRSIYEKDHLLFAFLVAVETQINTGLIHPEELQHFLTNAEFLVPMAFEIRGTQRVEIDDHEEDTIVSQRFERAGVKGIPIKPHPGYSWISEKQWASACKLSSLKQFRTVFGDDGLVNSITAHPEAWQTYLQARNPMQETLPHALSARLSHFQKLLLLRVFHPRCVPAGMVEVVKDWSGVDVLRLPPVEISSAYEDSLCTIPLLFILDPGTDPTEGIEAFADSTFQVPDSRQLITLEAMCSSIQGFDTCLSQCMENGHWLLLKNLHMEKNFSNKLEEAFCRISSEEVHESFRLWITSFAMNLSKTIYRSSMRVVWDAPVSVRAGLLRSYSNAPVIRDDFFNQAQSEQQGRMFKRCLFALCMMHAAVLERSAYGASGWNSPPNFNAFDLTFCMLQLQNVIQSFEYLTVKDVRKVVGDFAYNGKFADVHDLETFKAILVSFFPDSLVSHGLEYTEDGIYCVPEVTHLSEFGDYIVGLPTSASAALFGLDESCDAVRFEGVTEFLLKGLQNIHFMRPLEIQKDKGRSLARLHEMLTLESTRSTVASLLQSVPESFDVAAVKLRYPMSPQEHRNRVLLRELEARNTLLAAMRTSLADLLACLDGAAVTSDMEQMALSIYYHCVPAKWMQHSSLSTKSLGAYLGLLSKSIEMFEEWVRMGLPTTLWLPAFFFPNLLLSAVSLNFAQHSHIGIESVALSFEILERDPSNTSMNAGIYLSGLSLTGACWDFCNGELYPLTPDAHSLSPAARGASTAASSRAAYANADSFNQRVAAYWSVPILHVQPIRKVILVHAIRSNDTRNRRQVRDEGRHDERLGTPASVEEDQRRNLIFPESPERILYNCPMYRTSRRSIQSQQPLPEASNGFIIDVSLPCYAPLHCMSQPQQFYVLLGTALLIEPDP